MRCGLTDDPQHADIAQIQKAGMRAAGFHAPAAGLQPKQIIEPAVLHLNAIVSDMRAMLDRLIGEDVQVVVSLGHELGCVMAIAGR